MEEAPLEIFVSYSGRYHKNRKKESDVKYIRSDVSELTWEDIERIYSLVCNVTSSGKYDACFPYGKPIYEEVLRKFNETRK